MKKIIIEDEVKSKVADTELFCIECDVYPEDSCGPLWDQISAQCTELRSTIRLEDISALPAIKASRKAYKACGKDPARYRLSAEALLRRIVKGEELYRINNIVDLLNLVSVTSGFSIGGYDAGKIQGDIRFGIGKSGEPYTGIGRGELNIEGLPVFRDDAGAFGSPTSDSERTCVNQVTRRFLMVIIDFGSGHHLRETGEYAVNLLTEYGGAKNLEIKTIK